MRAYERELEMLLLHNEAAVLRDLERQYTRALAEIKSEVIILQQREQTQSVLMQISHRQAAEANINRHIVGLHNNNVNTLDDFIRTMYTDGHLGTQFAMLKQGVPIAMPINADAMMAVVRRPIAGMTFAQRINVNMNNFAWTIRHELMQGLAQGSAYREIAARITRATTENYYRAMRIARTEGHRAVSEGKLAAARRASERGADVVKQWDSTLDKRTRESHQALDQQVRELDEFFISGNGNRAQAPGLFGVAEEDIHCRCVMLQRARWALDEISHQRMAEVDGVKQLTSASTYAEYKELHGSVARQVERELDVVVRAAQTQAGRR